MDDGSPAVSVITIFFNAERYFEDAIESVLRQSFDRFELLLVDDGSTDGSTAIARAYADRSGGKIRYLAHPGHANRGMSATRNLGLRHARGGFVAFIDADDVWHREKLSEQVAILEQHPEVGMVCGTVRYWRSWEGGEDVDVPTGHVADRVIASPLASLALYPLGLAAAPCPSDMMFRRSAVDRVGGFEEHFTGNRQMYEDQGLLAKLYLACPVYFSSKVWLDYRQHADSCVAQVTSGGGYGDVRRYFLEWFEQYLGGQPPDIRRRVAPALGRALWPYRYPRLHGFWRRIGGLRRRAGMVWRRVLAAG